MPGTESAARLHFIHVRSPHANAVPLLLIPPFPFTNLSLSHLISSFTDPDDAGASQPFHLVIPSLPGLGFSDSLPNNTPLIKATAELLDSLMRRLDYELYLASNTGPSANSPSQIDWQVARYLSAEFQESCLGFHMISPPLTAPKVRESPLDWAKWKLVGITKSPSLGYSKEDVAALQREKRLRKSLEGYDARIEQFSFDEHGFREPNTLSYALCDSPTGLLLFVMMLMRVLGPQKEFTPQELISIAELTWLPGPEAIMRFWAYCASTRSEDEPKARSKPTVGITVFSGYEETPESETSGHLKVAPQPATHSYTCPTWAKSKFNVVASQRLGGRPGLLAWERPEIILDGVRRLAKAVLAADKRMQASEQPGTALLEQVVVGGSGERNLADTSGTTVQGTADSLADHPKKSISPAISPSGHLQVPGQDATPRRLSPTQEPLTLDSNPGGGKGSRSTGDGEEEEEEEEDAESSPDTVVPIKSKDVRSTEAPKSDVGGQA